MGFKDGIKQFGKNLLRTKPAPADPLASDLRRCLGALDLTFLSIGAMIGVGVYITTGRIALTSGPSIVVSYFLAGLASVLSAMCYADLAARIPIAGSSYQFTYMTMGEFWGFFVGWNIILEHAIASAATALAVSSYIDSLFGDVMKKYLTKHLPMPGGFIATYPDFLAAIYLLIIVILVALGIKLSSRTNIFFATLNLVICSFIIISAMIIGRKSNWTLQGHGGFFPHGFSGTISGAGTLVVTYIGYEVIGAAAEEAENPRRNIPLALMMSVGFTMTLYMSVAAAFVSLGPWYKASISAPLAKIYASHAWYWAKYILSIGIVVACNANAIVIALSIPRYIFSMARDGLVVESLAKVNEKQSDENQIAEHSGISELEEIESTKESVVLHQPATERCCLIKAAERSTTNTENEKENTGKIKKSVQNSRVGWLFNWTSNCEPGNVPVFCLFVAMLFSAALLSMFLFGSEYLQEWWFIALAAIFFLVTVCSVTFISLFTEDPTIETFKIPLSPFSPFISIVINLALMMKLDVETWMRLGVWTAVGLILYFAYGYRHSKARQIS